MAARSATARRVTRRPAWLVGLLPLAVLAVAIGLFVALDAPGLERTGVPQEELSVERTVLAPGEIELRVRNDGADPVRVEQVIVNDGYVAFTQSEEEIARLEAARIQVRYPWIEGQAYEVLLLTATGATIDHAIDAATETAHADLGFYGLMALIGLYVGVIPVAIGMLWLPWVRSIDARWMRFLLAFTIGLLAFLGIEALLEGTEIAGEGPQSLGGAALVWGGAAAAYLVLAGVDGWLRGRAAGVPGTGFRAAFLVGLGLLAGAPAVLGAWIGASAFDPTLAALMFGLGAGAIAQVIVQLAPAVCDRAGTLLHPLGAAGILAGMLVMYSTGLLTSL